MVSILENHHQVPNIKYFISSAAGNRFLLFDFIHRESIDLSSLVKSIQNALYSESCDSALIILKNGDQIHQYRMIVLERDGSISEFCGNGARVVAKYLTARFLLTNFSLISHAGIHAIASFGEYYTVDMGQTRFTHNSRYIRVPCDHEKIVNICGKNLFYVEAVEPHLVMVDDSLDLEGLEKIGKILSQKRSYFPKGINIRS